MRKFKYQLTEEQASEWSSSEEARVRIRGMVRIAAKTHDRNRNPVEKVILSPAGEVLAKFI